MPNQNSINYAEAYQSFIDEELVGRSFTQWMVPNDDMIEYNGGKTVKIARIDTTGLGDYNANAPVGTAYPNGGVDLVWDDYDLDMDRAVRFRLGRLDPSDSKWMTTTENVTRTFSRKQLVPEQDVYRFNKVYNRLAASSYAASHIVTTTGLTAENAVSTLMKVHNRVENDSEETVDTVCFMNAENKQVFRDAKKNTNNSISFGHTITINGITYDKVMLVNELPVIFVPSKRLQTLIQVNDGRSSGQEKGGITIDSASKQIEFLILNSDAPMAINRIDSLKVFEADQMQESDETTINYHLFYGCWLLENQIVATGACIRE